MESVIGQDIPTLKMMKRLLRNFHNGRTASLTVVFHAALPVDVRWFRGDLKHATRASELANMLPIAKGRSNYWCRHVGNRK